MTDDAELLLRYARDHSEAAFVEIVHRRLDGVYSAALRRVGGDAHLAQDVTQRVFVALAQKAKSLAAHPFLTGWIYTAARKEAANLVRTEQRRRIREHEAQVLAESASDAVDWARLSPLLDEAIDGLAEPDQRVVLLRFVDRQRYAEIGAALRLSEDAARMRTDRALEQLKAALQRRGVMSTAAALELVMAENAVGAVPAGVISAVTQAALAGGATTLGAGAVGGALLGILGSPLFLATVLLVGGVATAGFEYRQFRAAGYAVRAAQESYARLLEQLHADQRQKALAESSRPVAAAKAAAAPPVSPLPAPPPPSKEGKAFLERHPEVKAAFTAWLDGNTYARFSVLFRRLGLTPDQVAQFEAILRSGRGLSFSQGSSDAVLDFSVEAQPEKDQQAALRQLLGPDGYRQYENYAPTVYQRGAVADLAAALIGIEAPFTPLQAEQMETIFSGAGPGVGSTDFDWRQVIARAQGILSAPQQEMLENFRIQQEALRQLNASS